MIYGHVTRHGIRRYRLQVTLTRAFGCIFGAAAFGSTGVSMFSVIGVTIAAGFACAGNGNGAAAA